MEKILKNTTKGWHVFYVQRRHEKKIYDRLVENGFETYLPLEKVLKQWSQRKKWVEEPLFKSYIFVRISPKNIMKVLQVPGIVTYVKHSGKPAIIRDNHLELVKSLLKNETSFEVMDVSIDVGSEIEITTGPFKGMKGHVKEIRGNRKLVVNLDTITYSIIVDYP